MGKRANGDGSIWHDAAWDKWRGEYIVGYTPEGKKQTVSFASDKRGEVRDWLAQIAVDRKNGIVVEPTKVTVAAYLESWLTSVVDHGCKRSTAATYRQLVAAYIVPHIGNVLLQKLTPQEVQAMYSAKLKDNLSRRTVHHIHMVLHRALAIATKQRVVSYNVLDHVEPPKPKNVEMKTLTFEQVARFLQVAQGDRHYPLYVLALQLGMRIGEICGLRWKDVDLDNGTLSIRQTYTQVRGRMEFSTPKSDSSIRVIDMPDELSDVLAKWKVSQAKERLAFGKPWKHPELVFTTHDGSAVHPNNLRRRSFNGLLTKAGCPHMRIHDLRHTALTLMGEMDIHPSIVQQTAGHSDISVTLGTYGHVFREKQKEAARTMDRFWKDMKTDVSKSRIR